MPKYLIVTFLVLYSVSAISQDSTNPVSFKWDNGFKLESQDEQFSFKFGGRIMVDHAYFFQSDELTEKFGPLITKSGTEIRRARIFLEGKIYENTHFKLQVDFANDRAVLKDVYIGLSEIPGVGNLRIGHVKEPFRLATLTSSKYITFMEPSSTSFFAQERNNGIVLFNDFFNNRLSAQAGAFRNANNDSNDITANDGYVATGRITSLLVHNAEKRQLLHTGIGYSFRKPDSKEYKISIKPVSHLAPKYIETGAIDEIENIRLLNFETAYIQGPFSFQGEYLTAAVKTLTETLNFSSYYGEVSYFLTGESKHYKSSYDGFDRAKPRKNFGGKEKGAGAWEIALRYSDSDLSNKNVMGGKQSDVTLGLNWYLNPSTRLMINHAWLNIEDKGNANILQGRLQIDF